MRRDSRDTDPLLLCAFCLLALLVVLFIVSGWASDSFGKIVDTTVVQRIYHVFGVVTNVAGVILGVWYFAERIRVEDQRSIEQRRRAQAAILAGLIDQYNECASKLLNQVTPDDRSLGLAREELRGAYESMETFLEAHAKFLELDHLKLSMFMKLHRILDKNDDLMSKPAAEFQNLDLGPLRDTFKRALADARNACWRLGA